MGDTDGCDRQALKNCRMLRNKFQESIQVIFLSHKPFWGIFSSLFHTSFLHLSSCLSAFSLPRVFPLSSCYNVWKRMLVYRFVFILVISFFNVLSARREVLVI